MKDLINGEEFYLKNVSCSQINLQISNRILTAFHGTWKAGSQIYIEEQKAKESSDIPEEQEARSSFSMRYQNAE